MRPRPDEKYLIAFRFIQQLRHLVWESGNGVVAHVYKRRFEVTCDAIKMRACGEAYSKALAWPAQARLLSTLPPHFHLRITHRRSWILLFIKIVSV